MPVCKNCGNKWSWKQTLKKTAFSFDSETICPYCKEKQYEASSRKRNIALTLTIIILILMDKILGLSLNSTIIFALIVCFIFIGISPFLVKLSNEKEFPL